MTEQMRERSDSDDSLRQRADIVYRLLGEVYGIKPWKPRREPLHELISTILSHRTTQANEAKAFDQLWQQYGSWEAIRAAPVEGIAEAIAPANWPEVKAPRIKAVLDRIVAERGSPTYRFSRRSAGRARAGVAGSAAGSRAEDGIAGTAVLLS